MADQDIWDSDPSRTLWGFHEHDDKKVSLDKWDSPWKGPRASLPVCKRTLRFGPSSEPPDSYLILGSETLMCWACPHNPCPADPSQVPTALQQALLHKCSQAMRSDNRDKAVWGHLAPCVAGANMGETLLLSSGSKGPQQGPGVQWGPPRKQPSTSYPKYQAMPRPPVMS